MNTLAKLKAKSTAPKGDTPRNDLPQYYRANYGDGHATEYDTWDRALRFRNQPEKRP